MNIFANRVKEILEEKDMKQKDLAEIVGISEVSISRYLKGTHEPGKDILEKIANALDVSIDYLLGRKDFLTKEKPKEFQAYDPDALEIAQELAEAGYGEINILFKKIGEATPEEKKKLIEMLKIMLPKEDEED